MNSKNIKTAQPCAVFSVVYFFYDAFVIARTSLLSAAKKMMNSKSIAAASAQEGKIQPTTSAATAISIEKY